MLNTPLPHLTQPGYVRQPERYLNLSDKPTSSGSEIVIGNALNNCAK
jgi:hypothetical protein